MNSSLPESNSGCYQLLIRLQDSLSIPIGRLGCFEFPKGYYIYTGSAQKGLQTRLARHQRKEKKLHWHIDYLLQHAEILETFTFRGRKQTECQLNRKLFEKNHAISVVPGFGSSDCRCRTHLAYFSRKPQNISS